LSKEQAERLAKLDPPCHLCTGICCKQMAVEINRSEADNLIGLLLVLEKNPIKYIFSDGDMFKLAADPCPFLEDDKCVIYDHRPKACEAFNCIRALPTTEIMKKNADLRKLLGKYLKDSNIF